MLIKLNETVKTGKTGEIQNYIFPLLVVCYKFNVRQMLYLRNNTRGIKT